MNRTHVNFLRHKIKKTKKKAPKASKTISSISVIPTLKKVSMGIAATAVCAGSAYLYQNRPMTSVAVNEVKPVQSEVMIQASPVIDPVEVVTTAEAPKPMAAPAQPEALKDLESKNIKGVQAVQKDAKGEVLLVLNTDQFFQLGTARISDEKIPQLQEIAGALKASAQNMNRAAIEIESHTDDSPVVKQKHLYQSNWELSAARAASLVHLFEEVGFNKDQMKLVGYGDSRPVVPNRDQNSEPIVSNAMKNRRIVLRVHQAVEEKNAI